MGRLVPVVLALTVSVSATVAAQEIPAAEKWTNVEWYGVGTWYFSDGEEALTLWTEHFMPVVMEVYPEDTCLLSATGEPRMTCFGPMTDGLTAMEWMIHPRDVEFMTKMAEREGEAVGELYERWENAVSKHTFYIARKHTGGM
jgi:hypothetical protein